MMQVIVVIENRNMHKVDGKSQNHMSDTANKAAIDVFM